MSVSCICVPSLLSTMWAIFSDSLSLSGSRVAARVPALQLVSHQLQWEKLMFSHHFNWGLTAPGDLTWVLCSSLGPSFWSGSHPHPWKGWW